MRHDDIISTSPICDKHENKPVKLYHKCVGCEIDNLNQRIREQEELLKWFRVKKERVGE